MKLPERVDRHITETSSFKIFSNNIPDSWIIRGVSERDYGIDCYVELVNNNNQVTGELISIQLKGLQNVSWTKEDYHTVSGINISTSNYWYKFPTPVFLCLVDINNKEVYYSPVKSTIRNNFLSYAKQEIFSYKVEKRNQLNESNRVLFLYHYFKEKYLNDFERNVITFISNYYIYEEFIENNIGRDLFMGVDRDRVLFMKHFYNNMKFICEYCDIEWKLKSVKEYSKLSQERFGRDYEIYEQQIDEIVTELEKLLPTVSLALKEHITVKEREYWSLIDRNILSSMYSVDDNGKIFSF